MIVIDGRAIRVDVFLLATSCFRRTARGTNEVRLIGDDFWSRECIFMPKASNKKLKYDIMLF